MTILDKSNSAIRVLESLGYTHEGGAHWKPPAGAQAGVTDSCRLCSGRGFYGSPGARCDWCKGTGKMLSVAPQAQQPNRIDLLGNAYFPSGMRLQWRAFAKDLLAAPSPAGQAVEALADMMEALHHCIDAMEMKQRVTMWEQDGDRAKFANALYVARAALSATQAERTAGDATHQPEGRK